MTSSTNSESDWPIHTASNSKFLYKISSKEFRTCRLLPKYSSIPTSESHKTKNSIAKIQIVSWEDQLDVLQEFDPADIIGAELQIDFPQEANFSRAFENHWNETEREAANEDNSYAKSTQFSKDKIEETICASTSFCGLSMQDRFDNDTNILDRNTNSSSLQGNLFENATAYLNVYCYPRISSSSKFNFIPFVKSNNGYRKPKHVKLEAMKCEDFANARACVRAIRKVAQLGQFESISSDPKQFLVIVNPYSGVGNGTAVYNSTVAPMLEQSGVEHDVYITKYAGHGRDRMKKKNDLNSLINRGRENEKRKLNMMKELDGEKDISLYDAIICVGGDGLLWEIIQGIWNRPDREQILKEISFGIIGCGTCNGLAKSITHAAKEKYNLVESTFLICKGKFSPVDLSHYFTRNKSYIGFLAFTWGFIADVDLESEKIRFLGKYRTDVWAVWRILTLRKYGARFSYLPPQKVDKIPENNDDIPDSLMPPLSEPVPSDWVTIESDSFYLFWASQVTHASSDVYNSPNSKLQDGLFRIMVIR